MALVVAIAASCGLSGGDRDAGEGQVSTAAPVPPITVADSLEVDPATVGMDRAALDRLDSAIVSALREGAAPGAALAVGRFGRLVRLRGYGTLDGDSAAPATPTTLYDLASLTKVVGTTTAVAILEEEGRLSLDEAVTIYLPWWSGGHADKARVTVRQLLLHRAGLPSFRAWYRNLEGREAFRQALAAEPLESPRGPGPSTRTLGP